MGSEIHKPGTDDGWHGVIAQGGQFEPEKDRYQLYIGLFCPFAHRANLVRHLKGLQSVIPISVVRPYPRGGDQKFPSWIFPSSNSEYPGATPDHLFGSKYLSEIYFKADPAYQGRYSVPVLWDKKQGTIVNNESAELLRWLPTAFDSTDLPSPPAGLPPLDLYPSGFNSIIDTISPWVQADFNTGVYKAGFATDQAKYEENVIHVFGALNRLEDFVHANGGPYILGSRLTELDIRVYATVVRLDMVYVQHFKCNLGTYTKGMLDINPKGITPLGPYPEVEAGVLSPDDWKNLTPGGVKMKEVVKYAQTLPIACFLIGGRVWTNGLINDSEAGFGGSDGYQGGVEPFNLSKLGGEKVGS
ncbi:MAG: hypothetical protein LQ351_004663 [Letrouitia transgressa]|nr:MAG: hypothetical protein LQ351_004663 [Letrouitia transgressa]